LAKVLAVPPKLLIVDELSLGLAPVIVDQVYDGLIAIHQEGCALLVVEQQVDRVLAIADRAVLLVKGAVAWEGPARDARPTLEARMLGGGPSANGVAPISTNGAAPPPYVAGPTLARQSFRSPGGPGGTSSAAPPAGTSPAGTSPAPQGDPGAPTAAPGGPDAAGSSQGGAGAPAPAPGGSRESSDHPSDLWVVGPTFPDTN